MATIRILRIPRSQGQGAVLLRVKAPNDDKLDLEILATESEYVYKAAIRDADTQDLRSSKYKGEKDEWTAALAWVLLGRKPNPGHEDFMQNVECVADAKVGEYVNLILRQRVSNITQGLGSLSLKEDSGVEIELFEWTDTAIQATDKAKDECNALQAQLKSKEYEARQLRQQLEELIEAKKEAEDEILEKAMHLINSKKLKIRDQQRLIEAAKLDPKASDRLTAAASKISAESSKARSSKRKAAGQAPQDDDDSSDGFENMKAEPSDEQGIQHDMESEDEGLRTPDASDDSDHEDDAANASTSQSRAIHARSQHQRASLDSQQDPDKIMADAPPPRRDLPFGTQAKPSQQAGPRVDDEVGESTDDEL